MFVDGNQSSELSSEMKKNIAGLVDETRNEIEDGYIPY